ncbi:MAG: chorismate mutase [Oscillospiraceae bacterium]|nr:chorismate mutase [Oscillospiraceae bacterium]
MNNKKIFLLRKKIDVIDNKIIKLLDKRLKIALYIAEEKQKNNINIYDKYREINIIKRLYNIKKYYLKNSAIDRIYKEILYNSVNEMKKIKNIKK